MNKKLLAAAISSALVAPMAAQAVEFKISGHVNRAIRFWDDGQASSVQNIDNSMSRTRFRFRGSQDIGNGMTAGIYIESGVDSNVSSKTPIKGGDGTDTAYDIRHSALFFSGNWGTVWMGHTFNAADGTLGTTFAASSIADTGTVPITMLGSASPFRTSNGGTATTAGGTVARPGNVFASYDGARTDTLRYDSPKLGPAKVSVSVGNSERFEAGLRLGGSLGGGKYALNFGYGQANPPTTTTGSGGADQFWNVSAAYLFSQGTNIAGYYSQASFPGTGHSDGDSWWIQLGHNWGNNGISISYSETNDNLANNIDGQHWGIGFAHKIPKPGVTVYAGYRNFSVDGIARSEDMDAFWVGSLITFQ